MAAAADRERFRAFLREHRYAPQVPAPLVLLGCSRH